MRRLEASLLVGMLAGLETTAMAALAWASPRGQLVGFVLGHGAATVLSTRLWRLLPPACLADNRVWAGRMLVSAFVLILPLFGLSGLTAALIPALHRPVLQPTRSWRRVAIPDLPPEPAEPRAASPLDCLDRGHTLVTILQGSASVDARLRAVLVARQLPAHAAVPILRVALCDPADDVRLLAYSMLDKLDDRLQRRIHEHEAALANGALTPAEQAVHHHGLAQLYWELVHSGLATGAIEVRALHSARAHAQATLAHDQSPAILFLLGRILLRLDQPDESRRAFLAAQARGFDEIWIAPFLAEIAFLEREFHAVRACLRAGRCSSERPGPAAELDRYWLSEHA